MAVTRLLRPPRGYTLARASRSVNPGLRRRLTELERKVIRGQATASELEEFDRLEETLTSSLTARVDEVAARIS